MRGELCGVRFLLRTLELGHCTAHMSSTEALQVWNACTVWREGKYAAQDLLATMAYDRICMYGMSMRVRETAAALNGSDYSESGGAREDCS